MKIFLDNFKSLKSLLLIFLISNSFSAIAVWENLNTGINDDLTGIVFWGNNGVISGKHGLYYTTTGGNGAASWTRFDVVGNPADSIIYNHTQFSHCYSYGSDDIDIAYVCGHDTVNQQSVIGKLNLQTLQFTIIGTNSTPHKLNSIGHYYNLGNVSYCAVGEEGVVIKFTSSSISYYVNTGVTDNLRSISTNGNKFVLVSDDSRFWGSNYSTFNFSQKTVVGSNYRDVSMYIPTEAYAVGDSYYKVYGLQATRMDNYDYGPLNATSLVRWTGSLHLIGTDHGIFQNISPDYDLLELHPSSAGYSITEMFKDDSNSYFYACGKNGLILRMMTNEATKPYIGVRNLTGGCVDSNLYFDIVNGTGMTCSAKINGQNVSNSCGDFNYYFNTTGTYTLELMSSYWNLGDTTIYTFDIVDPDITIPVTISDTIICQGGPIDITLDSSQNNVLYIFRKLGDTGSYGSVYGTGGTITFSTDSLTESGSYYFQAKSITADCSKDFITKYNITVEKTKANYHSSRINVALGDSIYIYEQTTDAQNFAWTFTTSADSIVSNLADPFIAYTQSSSSEVKLICWSNHGCYDSIIGVGPTVYLPPSPQDSCWTNLNIGEDEQWPGYYFQDVSQITPSKTGYFITGKYNELNFATQNGDSTTLHGDGGFLAKYSYDGTVLWRVYCKRRAFTANGNIPVIHDIKEDTEGNLYLCGQTQSSVDYFYDNSGDSINISPDHYIIKLDSLGNFIWNITSHTVYPYSISIDNSDNIYVSNTLYNAAPTSVKRNGITSDTIMQQGVNANYNIIKLNSNGYVIWDLPVYIHSTNGSDITKIDFDDDNNMYLTGKFEHDITFYNPDGTNQYTMDGWNGNYGAKMYIAKLDSNGIRDWLIRSSTTGTNTATYPMDLTTDQLGNTYISGRNFCYSYFGNNSHFIENTDSTVTSTTKGPFFITKINSAGVCEWIQGNIQTYSSYNWAVGYNLNLYNSEISVLGQIFPTSTNNFSGTNGAGLDLNIGAWDYFISVYDTTGNLIKLHTNGNNSAYGMKDQQTAPGLFRNPNGYYFARNGLNNGADWVNFGDTLGQTNLKDGYITHFTEGCGITYFPKFEAEENYQICLGSDYVFPDGTIATNIIAPMTHVSSLISQIGIDSLITTVLDTTSAFQNSVSTQICYGDDFTYPDGHTDTNITSTVSHSYTLPSVWGCDSISTITITPILKQSSNTISVCYDDSFTFSDGLTINNIVNTVSHTSTLVSAAGCDSLVFTTVNPILYSITQSQTLCKGESFTFPDGSLLDSAYTNFSYTSQLTSTTTGCDSLVTTIISVTNIDTSITNSITSLSANFLSGSYQWLDCDQMTLVQNETNQTFYPGQNGTYAVSIAYNGCVDTSSCYIINAMSIENHDHNQTILLPNPSNGNVTIYSSNLKSNYIINIINNSGQIVASYPNLDQKAVTINLTVAPGNYIVRIISDTSIENLKLSIMR